MEVFFSYILCFILCMSVCSILREVFSLVRCFMREEEYTISNTRMALAWGAISYIITFIVFA